MCVPALGLGPERVGLLCNAALALPAGWSCLRSSASDHGLVKVLGTDLLATERWRRGTALLGLETWALRSTSGPGGALGTRAVHPWCSVTRCPRSVGS